VTEGVEAALGSANDEGITLVEAEEVDADLGTDHEVAMGDDEGVGSTLGVDDGEGAKLGRVDRVEAAMGAGHGLTMRVSIMGVSIMGVSIMGDTLGVAKLGATLGMAFRGSVTHPGKSQPSSRSQRDLSVS
jgi:hypothetical protein